VNKIHSIETSGPDLSCLVGQLLDMFSTTYTPKHSLILSSTSSLRLPPMCFLPEPISLSLYVLFSSWFQKLVLLSLLRITIRVQPLNSEFDHLVLTSLPFSTFSCENLSSTSASKNTIQYTNADGRYYVLGRMVLKPRRYHLLCQP
jgi:hypothetical protein